jgi:hypothetical protein
MAPGFTADNILARHLLPVGRRPHVEDPNPSSRSRSIMSIRNTVSSVPRDCAELCGIDGCCWRNKDRSNQCGHAVVEETGKLRSGVEDPDSSRCCEVL